MIRTWGFAHLVAIAAVFAGVAQAAPVRVASFVPYVSEALVRIADPGIVLVATTRSQSGWAPPAGIQDLGNGHSPDLERLAASGADLLVADRRWHGRFGERAAALGMETFWIEAQGVEATLDELERLGDSVGHGERLRQATVAVRQELAALRAGGSPTVLVVFGAPGSFLVATEATWIGDLLGSLGARVIAPPSTGGAPAALSYPGYLPMSDEFLAAAQLDAVLLVAHGEPGAVEAAFSKEWRRLRGGASSRVITLDPARFSVNPGLGLSDAAAELVGLLTTPGSRR